jgi:hypothetical protein
MEPKLETVGVGMDKSNEKLDLGKTVQIMDRLHATEIFKTPELSKEFLDSLSFGEFVRWTDFVSGIETGTPIFDRGIGSSSYIESYSKVMKASHCSYMPPYSKYRIPLFLKAFEKAQDIKNPKIAGLTLSFAINAIHPYNDGNGRTGRIIYSLLSRGYSGSDEDKKYYSEILQNFSGRQSVNPNSLAAGLDQTIIKEMLDESIKATGRTELIPLDHISSPYRYANGNWVDANDEVAEYLPLAPDISEEDRQRLYYVLQDHKFALIPVLKTFPPDKIVSLIATRAPEYDDGTRYLDGKKLCLSLNSDDINNLFENAIYLKNEFAEQIINFSDRPDAEKYINMFN